MVDDSDLLSQLRLTKNTYLFNLRRRFMPVEYFLVKKKAADTPLAQFIDGLKPKPAPLSGPSRQSAATASAARASRLSSFLSTALKTAALLLLLILIFGAWLLLSLRVPSAPPVPPGPLVAFNGSLDVRVLNATLLTYGSSDAQHQPYVLLDYVSAGLSNLSVDARVYSSPPARQAFVLRYAKNGADGDSEFSSALRGELRRRGVTLSEIGPEDLPALPGGSTLLVSTGYLPLPLIGDALNRTPTLLQLSDRGVVVLYLGQPFEQGVLRPDGSVMPIGTDALKRSGVEFDTSSRPSSGSGWRLSSALYSARRKDGPASPMWGSISVLPGRSGGFALFLPQTLDAGWPGQPRAAGEDIARLIADEPYRPSLANASATLGTVQNQPNRLTMLIPPIPGTNASLRLRFLLNDTAGRQEQLVVDWPLSKEAAGELYLDSSTLLPQYLGGGLYPLRVSLREEQPRCAKLYFELTANGSSLERSPLESGCTQTTLNVPTTLSTNQFPGLYVLRIVDDVGRVYAASALFVAGLSITRPSAGEMKNAFGGGEFNFSFSREGQPVRVPYVKVKMSGPALRSAPPAEYRDVSAVTYRHARDYPRGNYTFLFDFGGGYTQGVVLPRILITNVWERPEVLAMLATALLVFGVGFWLRRPEKQLYGLDIPDFPPQSVTKIVLPTAQVLGLFEQINRDYAWERMPLKLEELKGGFRRIMHRGKPVIIGDYNLQRLLERLADRGLAAEHLDFWAPTSWLSDRGPSMQRLAMFRFLRDLFVNNAVRFSRLGAVSGCDVKILLGPNEYYLHFYLGDDGLTGRALSTLQSGRTWILFEDNLALERFRQKLNSSSPAHLSLKMQLDSPNKRARLFALDELPGVLKRLKVDMS